MRQCTNNKYVNCKVWGELLCSWAELFLGAENTGDSTCMTFPIAEKELDFPHRAGEVPVLELRLALKQWIWLSLTQGLCSDWPPVSLWLLLPHLLLLTLTLKCLQCFWRVQVEGYISKVNCALNNRRFLFLLFWLSNTRKNPAKLVAAFQCCLHSTGGRGQDANFLIWLNVLSKEESKTMSSHPVVPGLLVFLFGKRRNSIHFSWPHEKALPHCKRNVNKRESPDMVSEVYNTIVKLHS